MRQLLLFCGKLAIASVGWCCAGPVAHAQLSTAPGQINITATADSLNLPGVYGFGIGGTSVSTPPGFQFLGAETTNGVPNFLIVSPSAGTLPAWPQGDSVWVALNPKIVPYMPAHKYTETLQFAVTGQTSPSTGVIVTLTLNSTTLAAIQSVVNAATLQPAISPGAIVSIFGSGLGTAPVTGQPNAAGLYPTDLSHQTVSYAATDNERQEGVTFNGVAAPLLYYSSNQINAIVPYEVAGQSSVNVVVTHNDYPSAAFTLPLSATSPGIFTVSQNGSGQGTILNADGTPNSASNPAVKGSAISIFATGTGVLQQSIPDGSVLFGGGENCPNSQSSTSCKPPDMPNPGQAFFPAAPISVTIGGQPALLQYIGPSPGSAAALTQVNVLVPAGIGSGPQPVVLTAGQNNNSEQQVTGAVQ
jgi:uncharacterized protein (TIGR03437 family)